MRITQKEFEFNLGEVSFPLAVATSGGADSLALLLLAHTHAQKKRGRVIGVTVNHGLRAESKTEALRVHQWAHERGIEHIILEWTGEKPATRLQEKARAVRYQLLTDWCKIHHIPTVLLGHHQQDQEETFWQRLTSGSGLNGLCGMKRQVVREGITFIRPFLGFPKERLVATLKAEKQAWIEDPSNEDARFFRGRFRTFLKEEGLSSFRLAHVMKKLQEDQDFIQKSFQKALQSTVQTYAEGYLILYKKPFEDLHPALAKRLIAFILQWISEKDYPPRMSQVALILEKLKKQTSFTAGGMYWKPEKEDILLSREPAAIKDRISLASLDKKTLWDHRFWIDPHIKEYVPCETYLAALGPMNKIRQGSKLSAWLRSARADNKPSALDPASLVGLNSYEESLVTIKKLISSIPSFILPTLPALWIKGEVVAVPHCCYSTFKSEKDLRKFFYLRPLFHDSLRFTI